MQNYKIQFDMTLVIAIIIGLIYHGKFLLNVFEILIDFRLITKINYLKSKITRLHLCISCSKHKQYPRCTV